MYVCPPVVCPKRTDITANDILNNFEMLDKWFELQSFQVLEG